MRLTLLEELIAVGQVVAAAVGDEYVGLAAWLPGVPLTGGVDQGQRVIDVMPVAARESDGQRSAAAVADQSGFEQVLPQ